MAKNWSNQKVTAGKKKKKNCFSQEPFPRVLGVWHGRNAGGGRSLKSDLGVSWRNASNQPRGITSSLGSGWAGSRGQAARQAWQTLSPEINTQTAVKVWNVERQTRNFTSEFPERCFFFFLSFLLNVIFWLNCLTYSRCVNISMWFWVLCCFGLHQPYLH